MATVGSLNPTLQDVASRTVDGKISAVAELMNQMNEVVKEMTMVEGNLATGHKTTIRSGIPTPTWRMLYQGVQPTKSKTVQVTDTTGMLEAYAEVDKDIADLNGNTAEFRLSEDKAFLEGINQSLASAIFYGNSQTDPEKIMGLAPRYNSKSAENATNIIDAGGTGSTNTSIWLVTWSPETCHAIYPKGQSAGLKVEDKGQVTLLDESGNKFEGYRTHYKWNVGLSLRDWRSVVRIANIDVTKLTADASGSSANIINSLIMAQHKIPPMVTGRRVIYCNNTIFTYLDLQTTNKSNMNLSWGNDMHGQPVLQFRGIPIRQCDQIVSTESQVV